MMSNDRQDRVYPKRTNIHYKYNLYLEVGLDPYESPQKKTLELDSWTDVCNEIFVNIGLSMDKQDESIRHCGKWYVTNFGRAKIVQKVDFYTYEYDSDTERDIQGNNTYSEINLNSGTEPSTPEQSAEPSTPQSTNSDENYLDDYAHQLPGLNNFQNIKDTTRKCVDGLLSCSIL